MRIRALIAVLLVGVELRPGKEMEVPPEAERRARLLIERGSAELVSDKPAKSPAPEGDSDPGDEQPHDPVAESGTADAGAAMSAAPAEAAPAQAAPTTAAKPKKKAK